MEAFLSSILPRIVDAAWRRRRLLLVPFVSMLVLSIAAALYLPGKFEARSLLLLQEKADKNPLLKDPGVPAGITNEERLAGLRALLNSEYVLGGVVDEIEGPIPNAWLRELKIQGLRKAVSIDLLGGDFIELRLTGPSSRGLGKQLDSIVARFVEVLATQASTSVGEVLVERRRQDLENAEREHARLNDRLQKTLPGGIEPATAQIAQHEERQRDALRRVADAGAHIEELRAKLGAPNLTLDEARQELADGAKVAALQGEAQAPTDATQLRNERLAMLLRFQELQEARGSAQAEVDDLGRSLNTLRMAEKEYRTIAAQFAASARAVSAARDLYEDYKKRFPAVAAMRGMRLLTAPERMLFLDAPKDPLVRAVPRIYYVLYGTVGGLLLGIGLAILAELLDRTIRTPEQLRTISGLPLLGRLPHARRSADLVETAEQAASKRGPYKKKMV